MGGVLTMLSPQTQLPHLPTSRPAPPSAARPPWAGGSHADPGSSAGIVIALLQRVAVSIAGMFSKACGLHQRGGL